jgi:hypothetical protein
MTSAFAWLDYSARERRTMLEVVDLFRERGTVDELGLGTIRDAFADRLFPGTSTLQSRTRYWLFIPWLYQRLEADKVRSADADGQARRRQAELVTALVNGGESEGVIGIEAKDKVLRPPSFVYWAGLSRYGLFLHPWSIARYHASLDGFYRSAGNRRTEGDEPELIDAGSRNWHAGLPMAPASLTERTTFQLTRPEAEYLRERLITRSEGSMLAWALQHPATLDDVHAPWQHPRVDETPPPLRQVVDVGERFSLLMYGAVLVYNTALAELAASRGQPRSMLVDEYRVAYRTWAEERIAPRLDELRAWDRSELWAVVAELIRGPVTRTRDFAERWMTTLLADPTRALDLPDVRSLIASREQVMKGRLARLQNPAALERWNGRSGVYELTYRWSQGRTVLRDIASGLRRAEEPDA